MLHMVGPLFLDEISSLPLDLQPKLLDVLERKRFRPLGGKSELETDFRLVAASLGSLSQEVKAGRFREDLYYRLAVVEIIIPPLRERLEDIPLLSHNASWNSFLPMRMSISIQRRCKNYKVICGLETLENYATFSNVL